MSCHLLRSAATVVLMVLPPALHAQRAAPTTADSALVRRILIAEDRRDTADAALAEGTRSADPRVSALARRALARMRDTLFTVRDASRDSFPPLAAAHEWPDPSWKVRYRALTAQRSDCGALRAALADSLWPVRFRAMALLTPACAGDDSIVRTVAGWVDQVPATTQRRARGGVSWHGAAHGIVALARMMPESARPRIAQLARHRQWQLRMYAARAAALASDTATLRTLARDRDGNVQEAAITGLSKLTAHADDALYLTALKGRGAQAVRAAAIALKGSPRPEVRAAASAAFGRWVATANASARDARLALLEAAGRPASDDRPPPSRVELPASAVALALGADIRLRVTMAPASGGGSFVVRLRGDAAPITASRILSLAERRYYDGTGWHRVEHDFVIQGGGPGANEYVGHHRFFRDELATIVHDRGTIGMSTRGHDTGDGQWFVNLRDNPRLVRDYTVFAEVVEGMDVVDGILEGDVIAEMRRLR